MFDYYNLKLLTYLHLSMSIISYYNYITVLLNFKKSLNRLCNSSNRKQAKLYVPELPFAHSQLIKNKRVHHFSNVSDGMGEVYKTPCIVFAGHPSLR